MSIISMNKYLI